MEYAVIFEKVSLCYRPDIPVLKDIQCHLPAGSFHFLMGESGAGKSSLLKLMYAGHRDYRGTVRIFGRDNRYLTPADVTLLRQKIGVVFQDFHLLDHLTCLDNVALPLRLRGESWSFARRRAWELLEWIGLEAERLSFPETLSGGQKQRIVIARAVVNRPTLLLADEPTGNLDDENAFRLMELFGELNRAGTTIVLATHNRFLPTLFDAPIMTITGGRLQITSGAGATHDKGYAYGAA